MAKALQYRLWYYVLVFLLGSCAHLPPAFAQTEGKDPEGRIVSKIRIDGLRRTKEYIVRRELVSKVGEPYHESDSARELQNLELLDVFSDIDIQTSVVRDSVEIRYRLVETLPILPTVTLKISDENGISAGAGVKSPNAFGRDIFTSLRAVFGGETEVEIWIDNPWVAGNRLGYTLEYYHRERENLIGDFYEKADEFSLRVGSNVRIHGRVGAKVSYINLRSDVDGVTLSSNNTDNVTRMQVYAGYDSRDAFSDTRRGWWNQVDVSREMRLFHSDSDFYELTVDLRRYQPLPYSDRHGLAIFTLTTMRTGTVGTDVAPWQQLGLGGTNTVRGWEFASRTGKNQFINTLEYRLTLRQPSLIELPLGINIRGGLQLGLFGDTGIVWDQAPDFAARNFIAGGGIGLRGLVPIVGMLRLDFGWGQSGKGVILALGSFEKPVMARRRVR